MCDDELGPARGIVLGVGISLTIWALGFGIYLTVSG